MKFQLVASGDFFDVDGFLATTNLDYQRVFRRGENTTQFNSGFTQVLGNELKLNFSEQVKAAVRFIDEHKDELARLVKWPGVTRLEIILTPQLELRRSIICTKSYSIPAPLVQACAALGMTVAIAVRMKWPDDS